MSEGIQVTGTVVGAAEVAVRFQGAQDKVRERVRRAVARKAIEVQRRVKEGYLRGPRPQYLGRITGTLSRNINVRLESTAEGESGAVGTNLIYGRFHELGFHGTEKVSAHTRKNGKVIAQGLAFQKPRLRKDGSMSIPKPRRRKADDVRGDVAVKAHERKVDYAGKPFLRTALADLKPSIETALAEAVQGAM